jgi:predicted kinase
MKRKVLKKPTLVLMAGLPGVGKTTLAFELGQRLGWVVLEKDILKDTFLEVPLLKEKFDEYTAGWAAYENFFKVAENFLVNQRLSVILDTSFLHPFILERTEKILERAEKLTERSGAQLKIILCEVDESTRQQRLRTRKTRTSQAKAHLLPKEVAKQFDQLDPSSYKKIGTERPLKVYINEAVKYVKEPEQEVARCQGASSETHHFSTLLLLFVQWFSMVLRTHKSHAFLL